MIEYIENCPVLNNQKARVTSAYGWREDPITGKKEYHTGIDLVPTTKDNQVTCIFNGTVVDYMNTVKGFDDKYTKGNYLRIRHPSGRETMYLHMAYGTVKDYKLGEAVYTGQVIGHVGATGRATGAHLHFQIYNCTGKVIEPPDAALRGLSVDFIANAPEYIEVVPCRPGDISGDVIKLQRRLARISEEYSKEVYTHSFYNEAWDGTYGQGLKQTVAKLQQSVGWNPSGICDQRTAALLNSKII